MKITQWFKHPDSNQDAENQFIRALHRYWSKSIPTFTRESPVLLAECIVQVSKNATQRMPLTVWLCIQTQDSTWYNIEKIAPHMLQVIRLCTSRLVVHHTWERLTCNKLRALVIETDRRHCVCGLYKHTHTFNSHAIWSTITDERYSNVDCTTEIGNPYKMSYMLYYMSCYTLSNRTAISKKKHEHQKRQNIRIPNNRDRSSYQFGAGGRAIGGSEEEGCMLSP